MASRQRGRVREWGERVERWSRADRGIVEKRRGWCEAEAFEG